MRARPTRFHALIVGGLLSTLPALGDEVPATKAVAPKKASTAAPKFPPLPKADVAPLASAPADVTRSAPAPIAPATPAEANRERMATEARLKALSTPEEKEKPASKPLVELLGRRLVLLQDWKNANEAREAAERPKQTPEGEAAEFKADLEKTRALLDQSGRSPDAFLPESFQAVEKDKDKEAEAKILEARLGEMKEAIESARVELKEQSAQLEILRTEGSRSLAAQVAALRAERDKVFQGVAALTSRRGEKPPGPASSGLGEARDLARERLANLDWEARVEVERLVVVEAKIALATRRLDLGTIQLQAKAARVQLAKRLAERMEARYAALAERQRIDLKQAVAKEETRAAQSNDPLERRKARRTADLLELESQVIAYEKAYATNSGVSLQEQNTLADKAVTEFAELKKLLDDGTVSPLDALRLKNEFRRIAPDRAQIVRTDLAASERELTTFENALNDAEIDLVNDSRDDRFDLESLLEQLPPKRRGEAKAMLEELETRHRALLNRRRNVLQKLAARAEDTHNYVLKRVETLDLQYAFIRTHIFWIRDAEPIGASTLAHARDDSIRTAKALAGLALETGDRSLWGKTSPDFVLAVVALCVIPLPLLIGRRALDRLRTGAVPPTALGLADFPPEGPES